MSIRSGKEDTANADFILLVSSKNHAEIAHCSDLALASPVQSFDILLNLLLVYMWVFVPLSTQSHVEHSACQFGHPMIVNTLLTSRSSC